jgi:hypothetical protein
MKLIDLTMPVWPGAGYGEILPFTNTPVDFVEYMDYGKNGMRQTRMKLNGETGSPLMVPAQHAPFDRTPIQKNPRFNWTLDDIPLQELVLHDTAVMDIAAGEEHEITRLGEVAGPPALKTDEQISIPHTARTNPQFLA